MKSRILLFVFCLLSLNMIGQIPISHKCKYCGKSISECEFKGEHKCSDCGKTIEKCKYKGKHPGTCQECGKAIDKCQYKGKHPETCRECGKTIDKCQYKGKHPEACPDCGKTIDKCQYKGKHPDACPDCGKAIDKCQYKGEHPTTCPDCGKMTSDCVYKGKHPIMCNQCSPSVPVDSCPFYGKHPGVYEVSFKCNVSSAIIYIDGKNFGTSGTKLLKEGHYTIEVRAKDYDNFKGQIDINEDKKSISITLTKIKYYHENNIYMSSGIQLGTIMGVGVSAGGYIWNLNIEGCYYKGLPKSETIYWNAPIGSTDDPIATAYSPSCLGIKFGYGIVMGSRIRITPQFGMGWVSLAGSNNSYRGFATALNIGCKVEYAVKKLLGIGVAPEYDLALGKSSTYSQLINVSDKIKNWGAGFNTKFYIIVSF